MPHHADNNSRVEDFIKLIGLKERLFYEDTDVNKINYNADIDFTSVDLILETERQKSINYLINAIEK